MSRSIPVINTARLSLRPFRPEDFNRYADLWTDQGIAAKTGLPARSRGEAWMAFLANSGHWQMTGFGQWAITDARTRALIGQVGFHFGSRDLGGDVDPHAEAGWMLAPEARGNGLAREAVAAAHGWFDRIVVAPLIAVVQPDNAASLRIAAQMGYAELRRAPLGPDGGEVVIFKRLRPPQQA